MNERLALIGFGEAGATFGGAAGWKDRACAFDIEPSRIAAMDEAGIPAASDMQAALADATLALSVVTADQALAVAQACAEFLRPGALFCDMNSVAPETKKAAAAAIEAKGGRYVDVAVMAPVNPKKLAVPLFLSGPHAEAARVALGDAGFTDLRIVGDEVGRASTIKMLRSVMYKGVEALTAECLVACERAGVTEEVLGSFGNDWATGADYRLDRMLVHGVRRAAELREVCKTLEDLGLPARMSSGTVAWEQQFGDLNIAPVPDGLESKLDAVARKLGFARKEKA